MAATISVRVLDPDGDPRRGNSLANFVTDIDAVAQILATRIRLFEGEWFENLADGTPMFQRLLGVPTNSAGVALILRRRILETPYVVRINSMDVLYAPAGRNFVFVAEVETAFGTVTVSSQPISGAQ